MASAQRALSRARPARRTRRRSATGSYGEGGRIQARIPSRAPPRNGKNPAELPTRLRQRREDRFGRTASPGWGGRSPAVRAGRERLPRGGRNLLPQGAYGGAALQPGRKGHTQRNEEPRRGLGRGRSRNCARSRRFANYARECYRPHKPQLEGVMWWCGSARWARVNRGRSRRSAGSPFPAHGFARSALARQRLAP